MPIVGFLSSTLLLLLPPTCCRAAPGVQTLSTVPVSSAASSSYNAMPSVSLVNAPSTMDAELLKTPAPRLLGQSKTARITAQLVDCDLGKATCEGASTLAGCW